MTRRALPAGLKPARVKRRHMAEAVGHVARRGRRRCGAARCGAEKRARSDARRNGAAPRIAGCMTDAVDVQLRAWPPLHRLEIRRREMYRNADRIRARGDEVAGRGTATWSGPGSPTNGCRRFALRRWKHLDPLRGSGAYVWLLVGPVRGGGTMGVSVIEDCHIYTREISRK